MEIRFGRLPALKALCFELSDTLCPSLLFFFFQNIGGGKFDLRPDLRTSPLAVKIAFRTWISES